MVAYCIAKSGVGMVLLILRMCELCGGNRSSISLFFSEYFHVTTPIGLMWNTEKGEFSNGHIINPSVTSLGSRVSTV